jgi:glycosyltransferase involved in cell wall biosynthesis
VGPVKILWVKANKLLPLHSGGDIRSYHVARYLASRHDLCFLSYYDGSSDPDYERRLAEDFPGVCCVCTGRPESGPARVLDYISRLGDRAPYAVSRFKSAPVQRKLKEWLTPEGFDVAVCDFLDAAVNFPASHEVPVVLFQHNVESEIWRRHAETEKNSAKRKIYAMECRKMIAYEKAAVKRFPQVIAVSEHDRKLMSAWVDPSRITVVPTGVDLRQYKPDFSQQDLQPLVMFVGAMDWEPNIDAVEFFCKEVWPAVLTRIPQAKFRIVGRNPDRRVERFAGASIEVTGRVPEVVDQLREAAVVIVPLRIGGGTRLKIYEAMAAGKAIVSTSIGAEGLDVHHGRDITLADDPRAFAEAILMLLENADIRKRYERAAAELAARYDWPAVAARFEDVLQKAAGYAAMRPAEHLPDRGIDSAATDRPAL